MIFYFTTKARASIGKALNIGKYYLVDKENNAFAYKEIKEDGNCYYSIRCNLNDRSPCRIDANIAPALTYFKRVDRDTFINYILYLDSNIYNYYHSVKDTIAGF